MKNKIVKHIACGVQQTLLEVEAEAVRLRDTYPQTFDDTRHGAGLDLAVLREKLTKAQDLIHLLT